MIKIAKDRKEIFIEKLKSVKGNDFELIGEFTKQREKTLFRHNVCGHVWETTPVVLLNSKKGGGCPHCQYRNKATSPKEYEKRVTDTFKGEYVVLNINEYKNNSTKLKFLHSKCGTEFYLRPASLFINATSCPNCSKNNRCSTKRTTNEFRELLLKTKGYSYELTEDAEYTGANKKIKVRHTTCGYVWEARANHLLQGSGCPRCNESKGELLVATVLKLSNTSFLREYTFDDCRSTRPLPFDFALISNNKVRGLIEYDGEQHTKPVSCFGGEQKFKSTVRNDNTKNDYCTHKKIPLLRVSYTNSPEQIEHLVQQFLKSIDLL